jgi:hypothetical protein
VAGRLPQGGPSGGRIPAHQQTRLVPGRFTAQPVGMPPRRPLQIESFPVVQIVKDRLYFYSGSKPPSSNTKAFFFSVDEEL